jgi:hypothetical protein
MANRTAWTAGNGQGLTWGAAFNSSDLASLASKSSVLSSVSDIANGTELDVYADVSLALAISSATPAAGDFIGLYLAALNQDGSTYGDGTFPSGTQKAWSPSWQPCGTVPLQTGASALTSLVGLVQGILIPPGSFRFLLYLGTSSIALSSGTQTVKYRTYNVNLNN